MDLNRVKELILDGLYTDGGHHKQWFLEQILEEVDPNYQPWDGDFWDQGIAP